MTVVNVQLPTTGALGESPNAWQTLMLTRNGTTCSWFAASS